MGYLLTPGISNSLSNKTFYLFSNLPKEIQAMIWDLAMLPDYDEAQSWYWPLRCHFLDRVRVDYEVRKSGKWPHVFGTFHYPDLYGAMMRNICWQQRVAIMTTTHMSRQIGLEWFVKTIKAVDLTPEGEAKNFGFDLRQIKEMQKTRKSLLMLLDRQIKGIHR